MPGLALGLAPTKEENNGIKFDNQLWYDIDNDGDLDAVTSEQHQGPNPEIPGPGIGVIWYENPLKPQPRSRKMCSITIEHTHLSS